MITIPLEQLKEIIKEKTGLSDEQIEQKIKAKMNELSGLISEGGAAHIIANELGVNIFEHKEGPVKIKSLLVGMRSVEVLGKVVRKYELRHFNTEKRSGKVASFVLGDETGTVRVTMWHDQAERLNDLEEGNIVKIKSAYVRENNGFNEIHLNERSKLEINPEGVTLGEVKQGSGAQRKNIADLRENDRNVELLATIVDVFDPRFFAVCGKCGKRVQENSGVFTCSEHGDVKQSSSYVMNMFIDDGTENIRAVLWKNQTEKLLGKGEEELLKYKEKPETFAEIKNDLLGEMVKFIGRVSKNSMFDRLEFHAQLVFPNPDPEEELKRLERET